MLGRKDKKKKERISSMNNTKQSGFLGFLKTLFAGLDSERAGEEQVMKEGSAKRKMAAVKHGSVRRNDRKRQSRSANARRIFANGQVLTATVKRFKPLKPSYETLPKGTVVLIDGANLLHEFKPAEAPKVLRSVVDGLKEQGCDARIYLEHRAWKFMCFHQGSEEAGEKFKALCRELNVTIVGREADLAILQVLKTVPESVGLTNDRYVDYAKTFPDLVGTPRLRGFSVTKIDDLKLISVDGLSKAVKVEQTEQKVQEPEESIVQDPVVKESVVERPQPVRTFSNDVKGGFCGYGNVLLAKGNVQGAIRCFKKGIARHQSEGYAGLAEICHSQGDAKGAIKFTQLGEKLQRRLRDQKLRKRRLWAERRRASSYAYALCA